MLQFLVSTLIVAFVICANELATRKKIVTGELARKIPHITLSLAFAFVPFFVGLNGVAILAAIDVLIVATVHKFNWFPSSREIDRVTYGDYFFLFGTITAALLTDSRWIFAAGILTLGLADAAAALIGKKYGKHQFQIFKNKKSLEGSLAFYVVGLVVIGWLFLYSPALLDQNWVVILLLPLAAAFVEAMAPFGVDNLLIPGFVVWAVMQSVLVLA